MSARGTKWTGRWVADQIMSMDDVQDVEVVEYQILSVKSQHDSFMLGTTAFECVNRTVVRTLTERSNALSFIVNIPKESFWTGGAINLISQYSIAFGGMGDLYRALSCLTISRLTNVRQYVNPEFSFVEQALEQHDIVMGMKRIYDRKYVLKRQRLSNFTIVLINEYELTKDHVRRARKRYGIFDAILITNPNGDATTQARETARSMNIGIYKIGQLMARINGP